jgi:hypothetical protein
LRKRSKKLLILRALFEGCGLHLATGGGSKSLLVFSSEKNFFLPLQLIRFTPVTASRRNTRKTTMAIKKQIFAMPAVAAETPLKPRKPATMEIKANRMA